MKKKLSLASALLLTVVAVFSFAAGAAAANGLQEITAYLNSNITFKLEGEEQILTDATGVRTYPITYNGTTYIPIRSVANLLGLAVDWDQATQTILLGKQPGGVNLIDTYDNYLSEGGGDAWVEQHKTEDNKTQDISGINCSNWIMFYMGYNNYGVTTKTSFNVGGEYDTLTFQYYSDKDVTLKILGDNNSVLFEYTIPGGQVAQTVTVPLFQTSQLTFYVERPSRDIQGSHTYIFNAYLDAE